MTAIAVHLDAVITPPQSLSSRGLSRLMIAFGVVACCFSLAFLIIGAYPVVGFFGAEILLLFFLMRNRVKGQGPSTRILVTTEEVAVRRTSPGRRETLQTLPAYWARVDHESTRRGPDALRIAARDRYIAVGEHLNEDEQLSLAARLRAALSDARRTPIGRDDSE